MRKTVYVILVLCCFIIKAYSINRPYYHFKQLSIKEGLPTMTKTVHYGSEPLREYIVSMEKKSRNIIYRTYYVKTAITSTIFSEIMKSGYGRSPHKESVIMNMRKIPCKFFCDIISR